MKNRFFIRAGCVAVSASMMFSLAASGGSAVFATSPAVGTVIYELDINQLEAGATIDYTPKQGLTQSGNAAITVVENDGAKSIQIDSRKDNWDALDIQNEHLNLNRYNTYSIEVTGHVDDDINPAGAQVKLGGVTKKVGESDGYPQFAITPLEAGESFELAYSLTISSSIPDAERDLHVLRIQTDEASGQIAGDLVPFHVDSIKITLTVIGTPPTPSPEPGGETMTLYEMDADADLTTGVVGDSFPTAALIRCGNPGIEVVDAGDNGVSIAVSNRTHNYEGVDIARDLLMIDGMYKPGKYIIVVEGHMEPADITGGEVFVLGMSEEPWSELVTTSNIDDNGSFKLTYTRQYATASDLASLGYNFRIQTRSTTPMPFHIDNITITAQVSADEPEITELLSVPFEDASLINTSFVPNPSSEIAWVNETSIGHGDDTVLKVTHMEGESYVGADNAIQFTLPEPLPAGGYYRISVWFYAPAADNADKDTLTGPGIVLNGEYAGATGESKFPSNPGTLPLGEWKEVNVMLPLQTTPINTIDFRMVVNDEAKHADVWYIDDIVISRIGDLEQIIIPEWDLTLRSLAKAYEEYFLIGNVMEPNHTANDETAAMFKHHYNVVTAENTMKPANMTTASGVYNFNNTDTLVDWAEENDIAVHGHVLVWHSQSAGWLTGTVSSPVTRAEAKANMEQYIQTVAGRYSGRLISWDVVNEAFKDGVSAVPADWRDALRKDGSGGSPWYQAYANGAADGESGEDYIYDAFVLARLADPHAVLYYNDFNETEVGKREAIAMMTEELNEKWTQDDRYDGRLLIEGLGMQAHYWTDEADLADKVEATIARFAQTGAEVSISELDIPLGNYQTYKDRTAPPTAEENAFQAVIYGQLFEIFKEYKDDIARVTIWGKADPQSWRAEGYPLLFDRYFAAKPAYQTIIDLADDPVTPPPAPSVPSAPSPSSPAVTIVSESGTASGNTPGVSLQIRESQLPAGVKPADVMFIAKVAELESAPAKAAEATLASTSNLPGIKAITIYDLDLLLKSSGEKVNFSGKITISLPIPAGYGGFLRVFHVADDGTMTEVPAVINGNHIVLTLSHFSHYAIVDFASPAGKLPATLMVNTAPDEDESTNPKTGSALPSSIIFTACVAGAIALWASKKRGRVIPSAPDRKE